LPSCNLCAYESRDRSINYCVGRDSLTVGTSSMEQTRLSHRQSQSGSRSPGSRWAVHKDAHIKISYGCYCDSKRSKRTYLTLHFGGPPGKVASAGRDRGSDRGGIRCWWFSINTRSWISRYLFFADGTVPVPRRSARFHTVSDMVLPERVGGQLCSTCRIRTVMHGKCGRVR
jgi:hypothetical protein